MFEQELIRMRQALTENGALYLTSGSVPEHPLAGSLFGDPYYSPQSHETHVEMIHRTAGEPALHVNGKWIRLNTERPHIFLRGTVHTEHYLEPEKPYALFWMTVAPDGLNLHQTSYSPENGYGQSAARLHITSPSAADLWQCASEKEVDTPRFHYLLLESIDYTLKNGGLDTLNYHLDIVLQVKKYLDECYRKNITLDDLGALTHYAPPHLNKLFRRQYSVSIHNYLAEVRLRNAARMLKKGSLLVKDAAEAAGIHDQRYFSRAFRKKFGMTPSEYATSGK
ncbi:MAG: Bifunctional transcriptional activator/DNA repair enzyme AdaA [Lentisphaerae bacterium ADurb.Bin242]|nr:MAG: Bifunctional transcriptional activator/DNA repair enzyme AdaA [Lentisphaerae bacterium ADurb.Bin242]